MYLNFLALDLNKKMLAFHEKIKLDDADNAILREKRNLLEGEIRAYLKNTFPTSTPTFSIVNQGSYAMGTGIRPLEGESYDIDVALEFNIDKANYDNPTKVKKWVYDALNKNNRSLEWKRPCISVNYAASFHVDLAVFAVKNSDGKKYIARGYESSDISNREWLKSDPLAIVRLIDDKFDGKADEKRQFKRVIRYLKRWKDISFSKDGNNRPFGIALTACALKWFSYKTTDVEALIYLVSEIISGFKAKGFWDSSKCIEVSLAISPANNLFAKMSDKQQGNFHEKLISFRDGLNAAKNSGSLEKASTALYKFFGQDFI